jgi:hypothetical protein
MAADIVLTAAERELLYVLCDHAWTYRHSLISTGAKPFDKFTNNDWGLTRRLMMKLTVPEIPDCILKIIAR